ncbi:MAG: L-idonate 5-dehydrogenase, NAD-binding [Rhizobium sp.]|nr:L-idonate 5-dehydrogenase, NAD-binding [Rhizobium sp.]
MKAVVIHSPLDLRVDEIADQDVSAHDVKVRIEAGGICGSDLHYYRHGGFGTVKLREPMVLGHEISGSIVETGRNVKGLAVGQRVAVNPARPCGTCSYCAAGKRNLCLDIHFYGSAMRFPHVQGGFREYLVCDAAQAVPVPAHVSAAEAAFAEPLAVCLHAVNQAGSLLGSRVLITGAGPIGILIAIVARRAGAREIVVTDILDAPLAIARNVAADQTINVFGRTAGPPDDTFDVMFEAAGSAVTIRQGLSAVKRGGTIIQVGQGAEATLPMSQIVTRELTIRGAFRFDTEFELAVATIASGSFPLSELLTGTFGIDEARQAFDIASDKERSMKVQLRFH